jgi:hypothetical protein
MHPALVARLRVPLNFDKRRSEDESLLTEGRAFILFGISDVIVTEAERFRLDDGTPYLKFAQGPASVGMTTVNTTSDFWAKREGGDVMDFVAIDDETANATNSVPAEKREGNPEAALLGEVLVFTGALEIPRHEAADLAAAIGCEVAPGVTKKTTILVVGDQDIKKLSGHGKSSKHRKAEDLVAKGVPMSRKPRPPSCSALRYISRILAKQEAYL